MRFEELAPDVRYQIERAASRFLIANGYISLDDACQTLDLTLPDLWSRILEEAGLPESDPPAFAPFA